MDNDDDDRDLEESEELLDDSAEPDPVNFWEKKQRELVTSVVDYNLGTLSDLVSQKIIDLSPKYQRRFRWNAQRQSKLIESFLMNVPVPPIFLNEDEYGKYSVIDGKQRLTAIHDFFRGRLTLCDLKVFNDANGYNFDQLPSQLQQVLRTRPTVRATIILRQSDEDVKFEVFRRLNTGGVKLNPQEIRNSAYPGHLNDTILELSEDPKFHKALGIKNKAKSSIYQEMRDAEFVLRFFTFRANWKTFKGGMKREMDRFMYTNQHAKPRQVKVWAKDFLDTLAVVEQAFDGFAFRRWEFDKKRWRNQILAALFDAQMFACREFASTSLLAHQSKIIKRQQALFGDADFRKAIDSATNTPTYFRSRIDRVLKMLQAVVPEVAK